MAKKDPPPPPPPDGGAAVGPAAERLIRALLALDPDLAAELRAGAARPRPRPQVGPSASFGDDGPPAR
jgi:hypothetical protein